MNLYPLRMKPYYRYGSETPWGGTMLRDIFMKDAPENQPVGESLEISAFPGNDSIILNGEMAGKTLSKAAAELGSALTGTSDGSFPLMLKLIDARERLSVQVHPDDDYALKNEGKLGKTEAWVILMAEPDAKIVYGIDARGRDLQDIVNSNQLEECLRWIPVHPGDVFFIPAGTVHAIGGGIVCYEIQQSSNVTYRFWDWNRLDSNGVPRELHVKQAIDVAKPDLLLDKSNGVTVLCKGGSRTFYISCEYFELCRLNVSGKMPLESGRMLFITPLGQCVLSWPDGELNLTPFESLIIPAGLSDVCISGNCKVLMSSLPDRNTLRNELGYRASDLTGLMD